MDEEDVDEEAVVDDDDEDEDEDDVDENDDKAAFDDDSNISAAGDMISFRIDNTVPLSPINKVAINCILNECIDQLYILRSINSQDNANFITTPVSYVSIAERYMGTENHANYRINCSINNYEKLAKDIHRLINILKDCRTDMNGAGELKPLMYAVEVLKQMREDERNLIKEKERNDEYIIELSKRHEEELLSNIKVIEDTNAQIQKLRFEVEDLQVYKKYEFNYFESWEKARREQNTMSCEKTEQYYQKIIDDMTNKIDTENRCHAEFENYIEESKNDYLEEIQYWLKHYDEETERRETEMVNLKANMEKLQEDHIALSQKYEAHKKEIEDWLEYKRKKKEKEELEALQIWAAIKIQAWWRGVMFRKKLGPYRKKKGKGKDKDKKGKKGKK